MPASRASGTPSTVRLVAAMPTASLAVTVSRLLPPGTKRSRLAVSVSAGGVVSAAIASARALNQSLKHHPGLKEGKKTTPSPISQGVRGRPKTTTMPASKAPGLLPIRVG